MCDILPKLRARVVKQTHFHNKHAASVSDVELLGGVVHGQRCDVGYSSYVRRKAGKGNFPKDLARRVV